MMSSHRTVVLFAALLFISTSYIATINAVEDYDTPTMQHTEDDFEELSSRESKVFAKVDTNKDGKLTQNEMVDYMWNVRYDKYFSDRDGHVRKEEFHDIVHLLVPKADDLEFEVFDEDNDGYLSKEEAKVMMYYLLDEHWMKPHDLDEDGTISASEFRESNRDESDESDEYDGGFSSLDKNSDGKITRDEFTESFISEGWDAFDSNSDGQISKDEFEEIQYLLHPEKGAIEFETFDEDNDGHLSKEEGLNLWTAVMDDYWMKHADSNEDGELSPEEFRIMARKAAEHSEL